MEVLEGMDEVKTFLDEIREEVMPDEVHTTFLPDQNDSEDTQSE